MYVLATQPRTLSALDVDTGESISVPLKVNLRPSSCLEPTPSDSKPQRQDPGAIETPEHMGNTMLNDPWMTDANNTMARDTRSTFVLETPCLLPDEQEVYDFGMFIQQISRCKATSDMLFYDAKPH